MEPEASSPRSQEHLNSPYPDPAQSTPRPSSHSLKIHFNIILSSTHRYSKWTDSLRFPNDKPVWTSPPPNTNYMPRPSHSPWVFQQINIWTALRSIKLLVTIFYALLLNASVTHHNTNSILYHFFTPMWPCIETNFFLIKPTDALISQIYFCQEILHVSGSSSAQHQEFSTAHSALVYVTQVWWQLSRTTRMIVLENCHQPCVTYTSAECAVENSWWWAEELPETCRISWQK